MRKRQIHVAALNIVTNPEHSPEVYFAMLKRGANQRLKMKYWGNRTLVLESAVRGVDEGELVVYGRILCFTDFDSASDWVNLDTGKRLEPDEALAIAPPDHLRPEVKTCHYVFFGESHRMFIDNSVVAATRLQPALERILNEADVRHLGQDVSVTVEQDAHILEEILAIDQLKHLRIVIKRENNPDPNFRAKVQQRVMDQGAKLFIQEWTAAAGLGLKPDEETMATAKAALHDGHVEAHGLDAERKKTEKNSRNRPWILHEFVDADMDVKANIRKVGMKMLEALRDRFRNDQ